MNGSQSVAAQNRLGLLPLLGIALALALATIFALTWRTDALLEAWLLAFLVIAGLASGSLGLLMIAHLLGETWLRPVRTPLEAAASTMPIVVALAIPLLVSLDVLYPWATAEPTPGVPLLRKAYFTANFFIWREVLILILWIGLAALVIRRGEHPWVSAIGLMLLAPTTAVFAVDWVSSREPAFWSSLFAFAYTVTQLTGAMALALLIAMLQREYPQPRRYHSLQRAAITLALLTLWVWFAQFLIVWMANLPNEVAWYLLRTEERWLWLMVGIIIPALLIAIALLLPTEPGRWRLVCAGVLLLVQYLGQMMWLVRPPSLTTPMLTWTDLGIWFGLGLLWVLWFATVLRWGEQNPGEGISDRHRA